MHKLNLLGNKYGILTVIKESQKPLHLKGTNIYWLCKCDCGNEKIIVASSLKFGKSKSCGCQINIGITNKERAVRASAKQTFRDNRYNDGDLTFENFYKMSQLPCVYCGSKAEHSLNKNNMFSTRYLNNIPVSKFAILNGFFIYNGLDRINSKLPHNLDNVVSCCRICNRFKLQLSIKEFLQKVSQLKKNIIPIVIKDIGIYKNINDLIILFPYKNNRYQKYLLKKIYRIKDKAKIKKLPFNLTKEQIAHLMTSNCIYCNEPPNPQKLQNTTIDRLDSCLGYTEDNCVSACINCNCAKNNLTFEQFAVWINRITSYQKLQNDILK